MREIRTLLPSVFVCALTFGMLVIPTTSSFGHIPHDDVEDIAISPDFATDQTAFAVIRKVLFRTVDGGHTWQRLTRGLCIEPKKNVAVSPWYSKDRTVFVTCSGGEIYSSADSGGSWSLLYSGRGGEGQIPGSILACEQAGRAVLYAVYRDGLSSWESFNERGPRYVPVEGEIRDAHCAGGYLSLGMASGDVLATADIGENLSVLGRIDGSISSIYVEVDRVDQSPEVLVGTEERGLYRLSNGDQSNLGLSESHITGITSLQDGAGQTRLFVVAWNEGAYRREDGRWILSSTGLRTNEQATELAAPNFSNIVAAQDGTLLIASFCGPYRSLDGGNTWHPLEPSRNHIIGLDVASAAAGNRRIMLGTYGGGAFFSDDDGATWHAANTGLTNPRLGAVKFSPEFSRDSTVFAAHYNSVLRSENGGRTWERSAVNNFPLSFAQRVGRRVARTVSQIGAGRKVLDWIGYVSSPSYRFPEDFAISPQFSEDNTVFVGLYPWGLARSRDRGRSFELLWETKGSRVWSVVLSPDFGSDNTAFVGLKDGVYRSTDAGTSWSRMGTQSEIERSVLAISPEFDKDGTLYAAGPSGLFRSIDRGESWSPIPLNRGSNEMAVSTVVLSPNYVEDRKLFIQQTGGDFVVVTDEESGVGIVAAMATPGLEFSQFIEGKETTPLVVARQSEDTGITLFAASLHDLVRSTDGGMTWNSIRRRARYEVELVNRDYYVMPVQLEGSWEEDSHVEYSSGSVLYSDQPGSVVSVELVSGSFAVIGTTGPDRGICRVIVDGEHYAEVDLYSKEAKFQVQVLDAKELSFGAHTIRIEVTSEKNPASTGYRVDVDAVDISIGSEPAF